MQCEIHNSLPNRDNRLVGFHYRPTQPTVSLTHILHLAVETAAIQTKPASAGYKTLDFLLVRVSEASRRLGGLGLYSPRIPF